MKAILLFSLLVFLSACSNSKKVTSSEDSETSKILYSAYHEEVDGKIEIAVISGKDIKCTANILQISCDSFADEMIRLAAVNGEVTLKLLDEKSYYFTPLCNGKNVKLLIQYVDNNQVKILKSLNIKVSK